MRGALEDLLATNSGSEVTRYRETQWPWFAPLVVMLPCFLRYAVSIDDSSLSFGYLTWLCRRTIPMADIDRSSVTTGTSTWWQNLSTFGGWGIRIGADGKRVYNPNNGAWVEVKTTSGMAFRFSTAKPDEVADLLRRGH